jgi:hypothetical protein
MAINDVIVNRLILEEYLVLLPNRTRESVRKLLNPADPQDVPRAIELICAVADLRTLDTSTFNPSHMKTIAALTQRRGLSGMAQMCRRQATTMLG